MSTAHYYDPDCLQQRLERRRCPNFLDTYLRNREYGFRPKYGDQSRLHREIYTSLYPVAKWEYDMSSTSNVCNPGCVFNLEFSPDGRILAAACEKNSFMLFDPVTQKHTTSIKKAHSDSINCIKFLDSRIFATCSDDAKIALWDVRNLKKNIRVLNGHINWVKSIEYSEKDNLLVSSGFDGHIYSWDINRFSEDGITPKKLCRMNGIMRIKLLPDSSKMIICMTSGYIILISNLDLETLHTDIQEFNPNVYRLMQLTRTAIPDSAVHTHMFTRKRNRVEFIVDFPKNDHAEIISSIQIHPQGWNALSRNVTSFEEAEWTCVHDIQDLTVPRDEQEQIKSEEVNSLEHSLADNPLERRLHRRTHIEISHDRNVGLNSIPLPVLGPTIGQGREQVLSTNFGVPFVRRVRFQEQINGVDDLSANNPQYPERMVTVFTNRNNSYADLRSGNFIFERYNHSVDCLCRHQMPPNHKIHINSYRLTHFIKEANVGRGFIKELCYSSDGRIIFSPFNNGVRLLSFSPNCDELSTIQPKPPGVKLYEIGKNMAHENIVLCTKFSPIHPLLVSGCLAGRIVWYQPRL